MTEDLGRILQKHWKFFRIVVTCEECGGEFFDSHKERPAMWRPSYIEKLIETYVRKHEKRTGHKSIEVEIDKQPTVVKEIDCTVTVNG